MKAAHEKALTVRNGVSVDCNSTLEDMLNQLDHSVNSGYISYSAKNDLTITFGLADVRPKNEIDNNTVSPNYHVDKGADASRGTSYNSPSLGSLLKLYKPSSNEALQIKVKGNNISIIWCCVIIGTGVNNYIAGYTYKSEIERAIESKWSGTYYMYTNYIKVATNVIVINDGKKHSLANSQQFGYVHFYNYYDVSNVKTTRVYDNWKRFNPGNIYIYKGYSKKEGTYSKSAFDVTIAHEFGHILGIKDGYKDKRTKKINSIMCDELGRYNGLEYYERKAAKKDIIKALLAYNADTWQYWSTLDK